MDTHDDQRQAFTLLELILVLFILSLLALATVATTGQLDDQRRYEATKERLSRIKTAVVANPRLGEGTEAIAGFAADVGRGPNSIQELLEPGEVPAWHFDPAAEQWAGWRGPYLTVLPERNGVQAFRDGWGSPGDGPDFGWRVKAVAGELWVQSLGKDWASGGAGYSADYPQQGPLVRPHDYLQNLKGWVVRVRFESTGGQPWPRQDESLRVRLYYPRNGSFGWLARWPASSAERDAMESLSLPETVTANEIPPGEWVERDFRFGLLYDKLVPCGVRSLGLVRDATGEVVSHSAQSHAVTLIPRMQVAPISITASVGDE
jgi:prepilin-type N-terminal cleavage/methylation domain-containing protein